MTAFIFIDTNGEAQPRRVMARNIDEAWKKYIADILFPASYRANMTYEQLREECAHSTIVIMESEIHQIP